MPCASLSVLSALLHVFVAMRLVPALAELTRGWPLFALLLVISAATLPWSCVPRRKAASARWRPVQWLGLAAMEWFSPLFMFTVLRDAGLLIGWILSWAAGLVPDWTHWQSLSALAVVGLATASAVAGFLKARRIAAVKRIEVPIIGLPLQLHGLTIAQLSDLHAGPAIRQGHIRRIVEQVNTLGVDMVAITGDRVEGSQAELREHAKPLGGLRARLGIFVVAGNHEHGTRAQAWIDELRRLGLRVLVNEHVVVQTRNVNGAQTDEEILESALVVAGVTDHAAGRLDAPHPGDPRQTLFNAPPLVHTRVLLAHQPRSAAAAAEAGFHLQLSGHSHGLRFLPWSLFMPLQQPFAAGLHRLHDMWVHVSHGIGHWGPPKRFGGPSEITLITLRPASL